MVGFLEKNIFKGDLLVGGWTTPLKHISQNGNIPQTGVNIKKYLKPPPSFGKKKQIHQHFPHPQSSQTNIPRFLRGGSVALSNRIGEEKIP